MHLELITAIKMLYRDTTNLYNYACFKKKSQVYQRWPDEGRSI